MANPNSTRQSHGRNQRKLANFLLQPWIQLRIAAWSAFSAAVFSLGIALIFYVSLNHIADSFVDIGHLDDATIAGFYNIFETTRLSALGLLLGQVVVSIAVSVVMTHRMIGPTVALRRQIRGLIDGKTGQRVRLRQGDAFTEVADDLNELAEKLEGHSHRSAANPHAGDHKNAINE